MNIYMDAPCAKILMSREMCLHGLIYCLLGVGLNREMSARPGTAATSGSLQPYSCPAHCDIQIGANVPCFARCSSPFFCGGRGGRSPPATVVSRLAMINISPPAEELNKSFRDFRNPLDLGTSRSLIYGNRLCF